MGVHELAGQPAPKLVLVDVGRLIAAYYDKVLHIGCLPEQLLPYSLKNLLDEAILEHEELEERLKAKEKYREIDEIPFDFIRRRTSVVVEDETGLNSDSVRFAVADPLSLSSREPSPISILRRPLGHHTKGVFIWQVVIPAAWL